MGAFVFGGERTDLPDKSKSSTSADQRWEHADLNAQIAADLIEKVIGFARVHAVIVNADDGGLTKRYAVAKALKIDRHTAVKYGARSG